MDTRTEKRKESMKKKKQLIFMLFFLIILFTVGYIILPRIRVKIEQEKCDKIYANKILKLPDKEKANVGFTCTGLYWDKEEESFFIGNAGKYKPNDKTFQASIEIVEKDFSAIKGDIPCYLKFENMRDIQGVTKSTDGTIWLCSYGENKVRHIDEKGNETFSNNSRTLTVQKLFDEFLIKLDGNLYCSIKNENALNNTSIKVFYSEKTKNWCVLTSEGNGALIIPSKGSIKISLEKQINLESVAFYNDRLYIPEDKKLVILEIITKITKQMECNLITADSKIFDVNKQGFFVNTETNIYNVHQI